MDVRLLVRHKPPPAEDAAPSIREPMARLWKSMVNTPVSRPPMGTAPKIVDPIVPIASGGRSENSSVDGAALESESSKDERAALVGLGCWCGSRRLKGTSLAGKDADSLVKMEASLVNLVPMADGGVEEGDRGGVLRRMSSIKSKQNLTKVP